MMTMKTTFFASIILLLSTLGSYGQVQWPKAIPFKNGGSVTLYQPQPESLEGNILKGRSAISVNETSKSGIRRHLLQSFYLYR